MQAFSLTSRPAHTPFPHLSLRRNQTHAAGACRYEVSSQDDSFLVVFHTPADALGWCLTVQSLLLGAPWPSALLEHARASLRCMPSAQDLNSSTSLHELVLVACARRILSLSRDHVAPCD